MIFIVLSPILKFLRRKVPGAAAVCGIPMLSTVSSKALFFTPPDIFAQ